jgi:hypothetical protein
MQPIPDYEALDAKREEIIGLAHEALGSKSLDVSGRIFDAFCRLTPPEDPPRFMTLVLASGGGSRGGETRKPGNIFLNWRNLLGDLPDAVLTVAGAANTPYLIPLAALSIWNKLWSHSSIPLTPEMATTLVAMWQHRRGDDRINRTEAFEKTNLLLDSYKLQPLSTADFEILLNGLADLQCIEFDDNDDLWLREWVCATYS